MVWSSFYSLQMYCIFKPYSHHPVITYISRLVFLNVVLQQQCQLSIPSILIGKCVPEPGYAWGRGSGKLLDLCPLLKTSPHSRSILNGTLNVIPTYLSKYVLNWV